MEMENFGISFQTQLLIVSSVSEFFFVISFVFSMIKKIHSLLTQSNGSDFHCSKSKIEREREWMIHNDDDDW